LHFFKQERLPPGSWQVQSGNVSRPQLQVLFTLISQGGQGPEWHFLLQEWPQGKSFPQFLLQVYLSGLPQFANFSVKWLWQVIIIFSLQGGQAP